MTYLDDVFSLGGKTALITGARRGIGQAVAVSLAAAGADVVLLARDRSVDDTIRRIDAVGATPDVVTADLADPLAGKRVVDDLCRDRTIDILVNNAGTIMRDDAVDVEYADWQKIIDINLNAVWLLSQSAGSAMVHRGSGKIINIASLLSFQGGIRVPAYAASKHAVAGVTKALANEWAASNVQVNAIAPGYIATDNTAALRADDARSDEILGRIPAARWGVADDIAGAAVFLASRAGDYVNGHVLAVDGGWLAR